MVRWGCRFGTFQLSTEDRVAFLAAQDLFAPWLLTEVKEPIRGSWTLNQDRGGRWSLGGGDDSEFQLFSELSLALRQLEFSALSKLTQATDLYHLHSALVARDELGVLLLGAQTVGKSTLATHLWARDWRLLADDLVLLEFGDTVAYGPPRRIKLRASSRGILGEELWFDLSQLPSFCQHDQHFYFHQDSQAANASAKVAAIFLLEPEPGNGADVVTRLDPAEALVPVFAHSNLRDRPLRGRGFAAAAALLDRTPAYRLGRASLDRMTCAIEGVI